MALDSYGDASEWTTIARANGLVDPLLTGIQTILVPPLARGDGGVLTT
jgi:nucleoid-associated protein YgaU